MEGGTYALDGTTGQPDAGLLTGGVYRLGGGFWGGGTRYVLGMPEPTIVDRRSGEAYVAWVTGRNDVVTFDLYARQQSAPIGGVWQPFKHPCVRTKTRNPERNDDHAAAVPASLIDKGADARF